MNIKNSFADTNDHFVIRLSFHLCKLVILKMALAAEYYQSTVVTY